MKKKIAVGNGGEEELEQLQRIVLTRNDTRAAADVLFGAPAAAARKVDRGLLEKLFVQTPAAVVMAPNLQKTSAVHEKIARVFGESPPGNSIEGEIPYHVRRKEYESYANKKSREAPTPYSTSVPTGALVGGLGGAAVGAGHAGVRGAAIGGLGGALLGGLTGAGLSASDKAHIESAKKAIKSRENLDSALAGHIHAVKQHARTTEAMERASERMSAERRHQDTMSALGGLADRGPREVNVNHHYEAKKTSGKCLNCGAPATGGLCEYCGANDFSKTSHVAAFFEKLSAPTEAQQRYPELLKAAEMDTKKVLSIKPRVTTDTTGTTPTRSSLSGGSA
jgi:hypothetical protein